MERSNGLYSPQMEHDSCGIGCIANIDGTKSHEILRDSLTMLERMEHRGGTGSDPQSGDGAGVLIQIPHEYLRDQCVALNIELPDQGKYAVGMLFFPQNSAVREECRKVLNQYIEKLGFELLGYRRVPVDSTVPGKTAASVAPVIEQVFIQPSVALESIEDFERKVFVLRNAATHHIGEKVQGNFGDFYVSSFSARVTWAATSSLFGRSTSQRVASSRLSSKRRETS